MKNALRSYYLLTKPGIIYGNALAASAGYFFGATGQPKAVEFLCMLFGLSLVIASACVANNMLDRSIDARMDRTKSRALVMHTISLTSAFFFMIILLTVGSVLLLYGTNTLALFIALAGFVAYVFVYGWAKRKTVHSTLIGTISGSTPPVIGYVAATGQLDVIALILFLILVCWQMPHFYAIAIFRKKEYASANLPILSVVKGNAATRKQIIVYIALFLLTCLVLGAIGAASLFWTLLMTLLALYWLYIVLTPHIDINSWARKQFSWSLVTLLTLCISLSIDSFWH